MIKNRETNALIPLPTPLDQEVFFDGGSMITETDTAGIITYANKKFRQMTGYSSKELIGAPHSIVCHEDMPKIAFKTMWETIKSGKIWNGYVKNMCKDGRYYWVDVTVQPIFEDGKIARYIASRKIAERDRIQKVEKEYQRLLAKEREEASQPSIHELFNTQPIRPH